MATRLSFPQQWRHSSYSNYYIHDLKTHETHPLTTPTNPPIVSFAQWSPTGQQIAYVMSNDLYILPSPSSSTPIRVTSSGNASLFHGVPDWVYEEEVFSADFALWWSPNSEKVAFLRFDETDVDEFTFPVYNPTEDSYTVVPYPEHVTMKYPKPGYPNPLVSVHVFELDRYYDSKDVGDREEVALELATLELTWTDRQEPNNSVIAEVAWVGNMTLLVKEVNRAATNGSIIIFNLEQGAANIGQTTRKLGKDGEQGDDGWIEPVCKSLSTLAPLEYPLVPLGPEHLPVASQLVVRRLFGVPRHRAKWRRIQPHRTLQSSYVQHPSFPDYRRLGSHTDAAGRRPCCEASVSAHNLPLS